VPPWHVAGQLYFSEQVYGRLNLDWEEEEEEGKVVAVVRQLFPITLCQSVYNIFYKNPFQKNANVYIGSFVIFILCLILLESLNKEMRSPSDAVATLLAI
jgi:hypothetical protein